MKNAVRFLILLMVLPAIARDKACAAAEYGQFDFWIGEWEVYAGDQLAGHNTITPVMNGCVLQEHWKGASGSEGMSLNFYNPTTKKWRQNWVWKNGTPLPTLTGGFADGKMTLKGESKDKDGKTVIDRITWSDNKDGTVRQLWEKSTDGGKTWKVSFDGLYKKKKE